MKTYFMEQALLEAKKAFLKDEVPVGAVIVKDDKIIARAHNLRESLRDPTAHAEMIAIREAAKFLDGWQLIDCEMYVTVEPCPMCAGALVQARVNTLYIGAMNTKGGASGSVMNILQNSQLNHEVKVVSGILGEVCALIMKDFFKMKRRKKIK